MLLNQKVKEQGSLIEEQDWLKTKNRGLVSKIEQSRMEILELKGDIDIKELIIKQRDQQISSLKETIDKLVLELEDLTGDYELMKHVKDQSQ